MSLQASSVPSAAADLAAACVRAVQQSVGIELDFQQETLPILDHYLRQLPKESTPELRELVAPMSGAYFGELLRRQFPSAQWQLVDPTAATLSEYSQWRLRFADADLSFNPIGIAMEILQQSEAADWGAHLEIGARQRELVAAALKRSGERVRADDYYRFSVRFETIEQAYLVLLGAPPATTAAPTLH